MKSFALRYQLPVERPSIQSVSQSAGDQEGEFVCDRGKGSDRFKERVKRSLSDKWLLTFLESLPSIWRLLWIERQISIAIQAAKGKP